MRSLLVLVLATALSAAAEKPKDAAGIAASLSFRDDFKATREYQHLLVVDLRLEARTGVVPDSGPGEIYEAELVDAAGKAVPVAKPDPRYEKSSSNCGGPGRPSAVVVSQVTHENYTFAGPVAGNYALVIGQKGWLIPLKSLDGYALRLRVWTPGTPADPVKRLLYEVPATKIVLAR